MVRSSSKRANIRNICIACLCSPSSRTFCYLAVKPQVTFASLSSPAVMDIRRRRRRLFEIFSYFKCERSKRKKVKEESKRKKKEGKRRKMLTKKLSFSNYICIFATFKIMTDLKNEEISTPAPCFAHTCMQQERRRAHSRESLCHA